MKKFRKKKVKTRNPEAKALEDPVFKPKVIPNKKRKKLEKIIEKETSN